MTPNVKEIGRLGFVFTMVEMPGDGSFPQRQLADSFRLVHQLIEWHGARGVRCRYKNLGWFPADDLYQAGWRWECMVTFAKWTREWSG